MSNPLFWTQTYTGRAFRFDDMAANELDIRDIARPLSRIPRFGGNTTKPICVAEHCLAVTDIIEDMGHDKHVQLHALLHDAHEAMTGDIPSPFQRYVATWSSSTNWIKQVQEVIQDNILSCLKVRRLEEYPSAKAIRDADLFALKIERDLYMPSLLEWDIDNVSPNPKWREFYGVKFPMHPAAAYHAFIERFNSLAG